MNSLQVLKGCKTTQEAANLIDSLSVEGKEQLIELFLADLDRITAKANEIATTVNAFNNGRQIL
jgi:hypothetical protein